MYRDAPRIRLPFWTDCFGRWAGLKAKESARPSVEHSPRALPDDGGDGSGERFRDRREVALVRDERRRDQDEVAELAVDGAGACVDEDSSIAARFGDPLGDS